MMMYLRDQPGQRLVQAFLWQVFVLLFAVLLLNFPVQAADRQVQLEAAAAKAVRAFSVRDSEKDATHPNYGRGHHLGFVIDGEQGKALVLERGKTYAFRVNTGIQHDFYFTTDARGWGIGTVTEGVEGQFTYRGTVLFSPGPSTPDTVYYQCRNHKYMGGIIHIVNPGEKPKAVGSGSSDREKKSREAAKAPPKLTQQGVRNKIAYANMIVNQSAKAKSIDKSGTVAAKNALTEARKLLDNARTALDQGSLQEAWSRVEQSLTLVNKAAHDKGPAEEAGGVDQHQHYAELLGNVRNFEASYQRNAAKIKKKRGTAAVVLLDQKEFDNLKRRAEEHAVNGDYGKANQLLQQAQRMISAALSSTFAGEAIVYDKKFATPADEYYYEVANYKSYEELIPLAIEQKQPGERTIELMNSFTERGKALAVQAKKLANKGDHKAAIKTMQQATQHIIRALRIAGVR